jgi:DNA-binding transcriptional LysR family regulator
MISMESALHMVKAGIGIGFFTQAFVVDDLASGALVASTVDDLKPLYRESALVRLPRDTPLSAAAESFIAHLRVQAMRLGVEVIASITVDQGRHSPL